MDSIWMCPVCSAELAPQESAFRCPAGHSFDVAREGYVNLVLAQHRRSAAAGDPKDSVRSRRDFLEAGFYRPLAEALQRLVGALPPVPGAPPIPSAVAGPGEAAVTDVGGHVGPAWLDAGCGEGYYLRRLSEALPRARLYGVDLAKEGIRLAARASPAIGYAVGNTYRLPVLPAAVDGVLQVFAPSAAEEVRRVLTPRGWFVRVTPGPEHLAGFRERIYESAAPHAPTPVPEGFVPHAQERVHFPLRLTTPRDVAALVEMTPYKWHMNPETAAAVSRLESMDDTADFHITVAALRPGAA